MSNGDASGAGPPVEARQTEAPVRPRTDEADLPVLSVVEIFTRAAPPAAVRAYMEQPERSS